jgi:hypothetical protein
MSLKSDNNERAQNLVVIVPFNIRRIDQVHSAENNNLKLRLANSNQ